MAERMLARDLDEPRCPRAVGSSDDGKRLVTCGHTRPCPDHDTAGER